MICIYKYTNKITNESYIGQTINLNKRHYKHLHSTSQYIDKMILKYGIANFDRDIIEIIKDEDYSKEFLNEREIYWIDQYKSTQDYNITKGGSGNAGWTKSMFGYSENKTYKFIYYSEKYNIEIYTNNELTASDYKMQIYNSDVKRISSCKNVKYKYIVYNRIDDVVIKANSKDSIYRVTFMSRSAVKNLIDEKYLLVNNTYIMVNRKNNNSTVNEPKLLFGKYKNTPIKDVPISYLKWLSETEFFNNMNIDSKNCITQRIKDSI